MLAHNGLALITEKLQNQRLEEPAQVPSSGGCAGVGGAKLPQVGYDSSTKSSCPHQTNLAVKGKNVWALTVESERPDRQSYEFNAADAAPRPVTLRPLAAEKTPSSPALLAPLSCCHHKKLRQSCQVCESAPGTPTAPPKKKHCRSLSVPPDGGGGFAAAPPPVSSTGNRDTSRLWKPIAVIPLYGNSGGNNSICSDTLGDKDSLGRVSGAPSSTFHSPFGDGGGRRWLPNLLGSGLKLVPSASAASSDSGHFTTSDFQTPPGSPVPLAATVTTRPASASSDTASSFSSLSSTWLDWSGGGGISGGVYSNVSSSNNSGRPVRGGGARALQNRSLSCEDRISGSSSSSSPYTSTAGAGSATTSMPCVHAAGVSSAMDACCSNAGALSAASRCRSGSQDGSSSSSSGGCGHGNIPRCHSQPCVLHHRRCGKKRRRNCDRPTLNFNKMTETAYLRGNRRSEPWSTPVFIQQTSGSGLHHNKPLDHLSSIKGSSNIGGSSSRLSFVLNPIASSPLDSDLQVELSMASSLALASRDLDLRHAASVALPLTPPDQASPVFPEHVTRADRGMVELEYEEEEGEEEGEDDGEEGEDTDHTNCPCHHDSRTDEVGLVFPMIDLDLEQIENH